MRWLQQLYSNRDRYVAYALWSSLAVIVILSLVPGEARPHTGAPGEVEHFVAYFGAGLFIAARYRTPRLRLLFWIGAATLSGVLELFQQFVPGRDPDPFDAFASSSGLTAGLLLGMGLIPALHSLRDRTIRALTPEAAE